MIISAALTIVIAITYCDYNLRCNVTLYNAIHADYCSSIFFTFLISPATICAIFVSQSLRQQKHLQSVLSFDQWHFNENPYHKISQLKKNIDLESNSSHTKFLPLTGVNDFGAKFIWATRWNSRRKLIYRSTIRYLRGICGFVFVHWAALEK